MTPVLGEESGTQAVRAWRDLHDRGTRSRQEERIAVVHPGNGPPDPGVCREDAAAESRPTLRDMMSNAAAVDTDETWVRRNVEGALAWIREIAACTHREHRELWEDSLGVETLEDHLDHLSSFHAEPDTLELLAQAQQELSSLASRLEQAWKDPVIVASAERALSRTHERNRGPVPVVAELTVFTTPFHTEIPDLGGFLRAHQRTEPRAARGSDGRHTQPRIVVVAPAWVRDTLEMLGRNEGLLETRPEGSYRDTHSPHPGEDVLETALTLWEPGDPRSPFHLLSAAIKAGNRL